MHSRDGYTVIWSWSCIMESTSERISMLRAKEPRPHRAFISSVVIEIAAITLDCFRHFGVPRVLVHLAISYTVCRIILIFCWRTVGTWMGQPKEGQRLSANSSNNSSFLACFQVVGTVVPKLIFLNIQHIPEGEQRASPPLFPWKQFKMKSLLMQCLASSCPAVLHPCGFLSWKIPKIVMEVCLQAGVDLACLAAFQKGFLWKYYIYIFCSS